MRRARSAGRTPLATTSLSSSTLALSDAGKLTRRSPSSAGLGAGTRAPVLEIEVHRGEQRIGGHSESLGLVSP
jgi:hypothetical protein